MSKDNSEKKAVEEKQIANANVPLNEENKEQLKNGTSQTNEFENMGYVSGDDTATISTISNTLDKPVPAPKPKDIASEEEEATNIPTTAIQQEIETSTNKSSARDKPHQEEETLVKPLNKLRSCMYETDKGKKDNSTSDIKRSAPEMQLVNPEEGQYPHQTVVDKENSMHFDPNNSHTQAVSMASVNYEQEQSNSGLMSSQQQHQASIDNSMGQNISGNMDTCSNLHMGMSNNADLSNSQSMSISDNMTNIQNYNQHHDGQNTTSLSSNNADTLGPSMGVYTPDSATNSVHSLHGGGSNTNSGVLNTSYATPQNATGCSGEVSLNNVNPVITGGVNTIMESPNSISSVPDMTNPNGSAGTYTTTFR